MIDSHCHLDFLSPAARALYLKKAHGLVALVIPATSLASWESLQELMLQLPAQPRALPAYGLHPWFISETAVKLIEQRSAQDWPEGIAIGECGLDGSPRGLSCATLELQERAFIHQIHIAKVLNKPLIIHQVALPGRCLELLGKDVSGAIHGFQGSLGLGEAFIRRGFFLGLGSQLLNKARSQLRKAVKSLPLEALLLETDEIVPAGQMPTGDELRLVAAELALLRGEKLQRIVEITEENASRCFNLGA